MVLAGIVLLTIAVCDVTVAEVSQQDEQQQPGSELLSEVDFDRFLAQEIVSGRLKNRLAQDIGLLRQLSELIKQLQELAPHTQVVEYLAENFSQISHLSRAMTLMGGQPIQSLQAKPAAENFSKTVRVTEAPYRLAMLRPAFGRQPGQIVLEKSGNFVTKRSGELITVANRHYRVGRIDEDHVLLKPEQPGEQLSISLREIIR